MDAYTDASRAVFDVFERTTPIVEGISIDEAFLDVGGLRRVSGEPVEIADRLRRRVRDEVGLPITVGVASSKFLAKVASAVAKPDGLLHVPVGEELAFLHPLPVERLWGVGPITAGKLHDRGIGTIGEVAGLPEAALVSILGPAAGRHLHALAHTATLARSRLGGGGGPWARSGRWDAGPGPSPSWGPSSTLSATGWPDGCARASGWPARSCCGSASTTSPAPPAPTPCRGHRAHQTISVTARSLLTAAMPLIRDRGLTLVGVALSNLDDADAIQLTLPFDRPALAGLDAALDDLRERFGSGVVKRAALLGRELGPAMPVLPD